LLPAASTIPSSGADPHAVVGDDPEDTGPGAAAEERPRTAPEEELPLTSLREVVSFLERRGEARAERAAWPPAERGEPGEPGVDYAQQIEFLPGGEDPVPAVVPARGPTFAEELQAFLRESPLHTIIEGGGRTTATFGYLRVSAGETLLDEHARVLAIDLEGVVLAAPDGTVRVHLPPPGQRTYARRQPRPVGLDAEPADTDGE